MKRNYILLFQVCLCYFFVTGGQNLKAQSASTQVFDKGTDKLVVYSDVPGLSPSEFYRIRVRSNATGNKWYESFALIPRSLYTQYEDNPVKAGENYYKHVENWSHTYTNIEMNSAVEIEISKADGSPITKAAVHQITLKKHKRPMGKSSIVAR